MGNLEVLLKKAIEEGNINKVKNLIDDCDFIKVKDKVGYGLLNKAVFTFNKESDIDIKNNIIKIINILCENGVDINSESLKFSNLGVTPLKSAIVLNDLELVKSLIDIGADVNKEDKLDPYSPLMRAFEHSNLDIIKEIINSGGDTKYKNNVSEGLLHVFCMSSRKELLNEMIWSEVNFRMELDSKTKQGMTPLMVACIYGNIDMVNYLLEAKASINEKDTKGNTALIWTVTNPLDITEEERLDIVRILLENNCDFKIVDNKKISALEWSISKGYFKIAKEIMEAYNDGENIVFERSKTPIHYAVTGRSKIKERIKFINDAVKRGCDINYISEKEKSILPINIVLAHLLGYKVENIVKDELLLALIKNGASLVKGVLISKKLGLNQEAILESMI